MRDAELPDPDLKGRMALTCRSGERTDDNGDRTPSARHPPDV